MTDDRLRLRVRIDAPTDTVFKALTDADSLTDWLAESADVSLEDNRYQFWGRYAPQGDRIAFMAPGVFVGQASPNLVAGLLGAGIALAHGFPWDLWVVSADGSGVRRLAELGGDDATVAWSPDGGQLFVYGGTGSFLVDASTGEVTPIPYVAGYGGVAWLAES